MHRLCEYTLISFKCQSIRSKVHCTNKTLHNESLKNVTVQLGPRVTCAKNNRELKQRRFERRTSTGSDVFSLLICLDANKFVLLSFSSLIKTIYPRFSTEPLPNDAKSPLPVDVRRSKTLLLKLPTVA